MLTCQKLYSYQNKANHMSNTDGLTVPLGELENREMVRKMRSNNHILPLTKVINSGLKLKKFKKSIIMVAHRKQLPLAYLEILCIVAINAFWCQQTNCCKKGVRLTRLFQVILCPISIK